METYVVVSTEEAIHEQIKVLMLFKSVKDALKYSNSVDSAKPLKIFKIVPIECPVVYSESSEETVTERA